MKDVVLRSPTDDDAGKLKALWSAVFSSVGMDSFFNILYDKELCSTVFRGNELCAMAYLVPTGELTCAGETLRAAMIYAVATVPEHRGKGYGKAVVDELSHQAHSLGFPVVVLAPSDDSLFSYYLNNNLFSEWFYIDELIYPREVISALLRAKAACNEFSDAGLRLEEISAFQYSKLRTSLLSGHTYIKQSDSIIEYQNRLCNEVGGGFYRFGDSCAIVEISDDSSVCVKEFLPQSDSAPTIYRQHYVYDMITAIAEKYPADTYIVRTPASRETGSEITNRLTRRFGMIKADKRSSPGIVHGELLPWYGLALD
ncbi:MAG: GNAT family N-acetyltransferase [Oscillospiraceae bacterium]|nr:GNAT family N-acetyltransferase [Oscillospiraceae bacterium]MCL2279347.1 GNAT family N-acetyltransferase [Oscillospiraceae bacterium]